jgi:hypothetical protein
VTGARGGGSVVGVRSKFCNAFSVHSVSPLRGQERRAALGAEELTPEELPFLRFDAAAQECFDAWRGAVEQRLRAEADHPVWRSHVAKYRSLMPSLALIGCATRSRARSRRRPSGSPWRRRGGTRHRWSSDTWSTTRPWRRWGELLNQNLPLRLNGWVGGCGPQPSACSQHAEGVFTSQVAACASLGSLDLA